MLNLKPITQACSDPEPKSREGSVYGLLTQQKMLMDGIEVKVSRLFDELSSVLIDQPCNDKDCSEAKQPFIPMSPLGQELYYQNKRLTDIEGHLLDICDRLVLR